jgi:hypothetical protein
MTSGFDDCSLTEAEKKILKCFKNYTLVWPVETGLTDSETKAAINSLKKKVVINERPEGPYRLTAKGKRLIIQYELDR